MLVFSEIMTFMWQYYVLKDTKLLRQWKHSNSGYIQINQSINKSLKIKVIVYDIWDPGLFHDKYMYQHNIEILESFRTIS